MLGMFSERRALNRDLASVSSRRVAVEVPAMLPVRAPTMLPVRAPTIVPVRLGRAPTMVPAKTGEETITVRAAVQSVDVSRFIAFLLVVVMILGTPIHPGIFPIQNVIKNALRTSSTDVPLGSILSTFW
jgi:hypothetical protein